MTDKNKRDFKYWFNDLKDTITGWKYFVDFQKSFENIKIQGWIKYFKFVDRVKKH
ncbi:hypothetical protein NWE60_00040 [Mycoplasmopsis felis]|nr:DpnII family type II restriction endonuclease [Mycoplasmopsis felis]WAM01091.1 hypothetical protein NWE60_00040 [Mycoplasmopsis felis]